MGRSTEQITTVVFNAGLPDLTVSPLDQQSQIPKKLCALQVTLLY